ncbi:hypothetical protein J4E91_008511 [Alternaria rosae]|nr:hypothetical protein J4E91_008511 [Alternaria rosae]
MSNLPADLNTYPWYVESWSSYRTAHETALSLTEISEDDWSTTLTITILATMSGVVAPDGHTITPSEYYDVSGCQIWLTYWPDQIWYRRAPITQSESSIETKTLIPPAELPRPTSTSGGEDQTASAADVTTNLGSSDSGSSASGKQSGGSSQSTVAASANESSSSSLGGGAVAGIAIGGILVLALIIGGWFFWRRRQRAKARASGPSDDEQGRRVISTGGPPPQYSPTEKQPHIPDHHQEMPGDIVMPAQELDPAQSAKSATHAARHSTSKASYQYEPAYELHPDGSTAELPHGGEEDVTVVRPHRPQTPVAQTDAGEEAGTRSAAVSPNVEAQRRREMEWLDMEEERIRKKRETLSMQAGGKSS